jgi:hypothetical protein
MDAFFICTCQQYKLAGIFVTSPRIELGCQVPETCVLSIVLRGQRNETAEENAGKIYSHTDFNSPCTLLLNIFTAMASKITPKNLRTATIPPGPSILSM